MLTESQQAQRLKGVGGSDVAAIVGVSEFKTPLDVYLSKIGEGKKFIGNTATWWGVRMEPIIAEWYAAQTRQELIDPQETFQHPKYPWYLATPDRLIKGEEKGLEIKDTTSPIQIRKWGRAGTDVVPDECLCQCHWYLALFDFAEWDVAALLMREPKIFTIKRDREFEGNLIEIVEKFWVDHVEKRVPPETMTEG